MMYYLQISTFFSRLTTDFQQDSGQEKFLVSAGDGFNVFQKFPYLSWIYDMVQDLAK